MENKNFIYNPSFNCGFGSSFSGGLLGVLLGSLFGGWSNSSLVYPTLPEPSTESLQAFTEESKDASDEERKELAKKYFDPESLMEKYYEKLKDPIKAAKLNSKLIKLDAKIEVLNKKKQEIVDKWIKSK